MSRNHYDAHGRRRLFPTVTHWGNYLVEVENDRIIAVHNYADDPHPSAIGQSLSVIIGILAVTTIASLLKSRKDNAAINVD